MQVLEMYDGFSVVSLHWTALQLLVEVLDEVDPGSKPNISHFDTLGTALEGLMYAGKLQVEVGDVTLRRFRAERGLRDWQPDAALYRRDPLPPRNEVGDLVSKATSEVSS